MTGRYRRRWHVGLIGTVALVGFGLVYASPTLLAATVIPLLYVLYGTLSDVPADATLAIEREFDPPGPNPGETVDVTLTVRNTTESTLPDVRVIDSVPEELAVTTGSPRNCAPLSPGEDLTVEYTIVAKRGEYGFDDALVRLRSLSASHDVTGRVPTHGDETLTCANTIREPPIDDAALPRAGTLPTDSGGSGLEFYATRQYRAGDPMNRIDWRHYAKADEFVTIQYREEQAARTVVVVDARPIGRVTPAAGYPTGTSLCAYAGERMYEALNRAGVVTSVTAVGLERGSLGGLVGPDGLPWIDPEAHGDAAHRPETLFRGIQEVATTEVTPLSTQPPRTVEGGRARQSERGDATRRGVRADGNGPRNSAESSRTTHGGPQASGRGGDAKRQDRARSTGTASREARNGEYASGSTRSGARRPTGEQILDVETDRPETDAIERLLARLPPNAQVLVCSPVVDNWSVRLAHSLTTRGYPFLVLSPDVLQGDTTGQRIAAVHRRLRMRALERRGRAVGWDPDDPIDYALRTALPQLLDHQ